MGSSLLTSRNVYFLIILCIVGFAFYLPLKELIQLSMTYDAVYSHIVLVPLISAYFMVTERKQIFSEPGTSSAGGIFLIILGILFAVTGILKDTTLNQNDYLSLMTFSAVIFLIGGFLIIYGKKTFQNAKFPLLFLFFMVPIPTFIVDEIIALLLKGSAHIAEAGFMISGIPFFREGPMFHLSNFKIHVADECSGIRSSLSLFIASIIAGHLFLKTSWRKIVLCLSVIPIAIMRNGLRIVMLSLLGNYVDARILSSALHRKGGIPLFILSFAIMMIICWYLRKREGREILHNEVSIRQD